MMINSKMLSAYALTKCYPRPNSIDYTNTIERFIGQVNSLALSTPPRESAR